MHKPQEGNSKVSFNGTFYFFNKDVGVYGFYSQWFKQLDIKKILYLEQPDHLNYYT